MSTAEQEAYNEGREACQKAAGELDAATNPYPHKSERWQYWNRGWNSVHFSDGEEELS